MKQQSQQDSRYIEARTSHVRYAPALFVGERAGIASRLRGAAIYFGEFSKGFIAVANATHSPGAGVAVLVQPSLSRTAQRML